MEANTRNFKDKTKQAFETVRECAETALVLLFIVNGLATFLILFNLVEAGEAWRNIIGSVAFAFSSVALVRFTNHGVRHQTRTKKGRK